MSRTELVDHVQRKQDHLNIVVASGGLRSGVAAATVITPGANLVGFAAPPGGRRLRVGLA